MRSGVLDEKTVRQAERHLKKNDPVLGKVIKQSAPCDLWRENQASLFEHLVYSIIGQQLSTKAAHTIRLRVVKCLRKTTPGRILAAPEETLRQAGLSQAKTRYIKALSEAVGKKKLDLDNLVGKPSEQVVETLTALPGIGAWTAEMFLIFALKHADVMSLGDVGLQRAAKMLYGATADLQEIARAWTPFRSVASWHLWNHLDNKPQ